GTSPLPLPPSPPKVGIWAVLHESRSDWAQLLTSLYLIIVGPGQWSLDALLHPRRAPAPPAPPPPPARPRRRRHRAGFAPRDRADGRNRPALTVTGLGPAPIGGATTG